MTGYFSACPQDSPAIMGIDGGHHCHPVSRRLVLRAGGAGLAVGLAGCVGGPGTPAPVALTGGVACDVCGMVIEKHPGPDGQIFYRNQSPAGHDNPARFDSLKQCFFPYFLEHRQRGWTATVLYVIDYSAIDYTLQTDAGDTYISSHPEADAFAPARDLSYVVGSDIVGAMGPDFIPFTDRTEAVEFAAEHGGRVLAFADIDEGVIGR